MDLATDAGPVVSLVVSGVSTSVPLRKDADGRLGLQFVEGTPSGSVQGAVVASVLSRSAARDAGLRGGDLVRMHAVPAYAVPAYAVPAYAVLTAHCSLAYSRLLQVIAVGDQLVFDVAAARDCIGNAARGLTLVTWRPRADAPGGDEPLAGQSRPSSTELDSEGRHALRQEWYFTADAKMGLPEGALLYEDLTVAPR